MVQILAGLITYLLLAIQTAYKISKSRMLGNYKQKLNRNLVRESESFSIKTF